MTEHTGAEAEVPFLGAEWFDPLEAGVRQQIRRFIEELLEEEVAAALQRGRYERAAGAAGYRPFDKLRRPPRAAAGGDLRPGQRVGAAGPRAGGNGRAGGVAQSGAAGLPASDAASRGADRRGLSGRDQHAACATGVGGAPEPVEGSVGWSAKTRSAGSGRSCGPIGRDGSSARWPMTTSSGCCSTAPWFGCASTAGRPPCRCWWRWGCGAMASPSPGSGVLLAVRNMGGESEAAWRALLDDMIARGLPTPELLIVDGGSGPSTSSGGKGAGRPVAGGSSAALHRPQASQSVGPRAEEAL